MLNGLWTLTWLEVKIFLREPLGALGTIAFPIAVFALASRFAGGKLTGASTAVSGLLRTGVPVFAAVMVALSAVPSLVTIINSLAPARRCPERPGGLREGKISAEAKEDKRALIPSGQILPNPLSRHPPAGLMPPAAAAGRPLLRISSGA